MGNEGFFALGMVDVRNHTASDSKTSVSFFRAADGREIQRVRDLKFPPSRKFKLPAFPQASNLFCEITPARFRQRKSEFFTLSHGETITRQLTVFRLPSRWAAKFTSWARLSADFNQMKNVLAVSPNLKVKGGKRFPAFTDSVYDSIEDEKTVLAKSCLLNLAVKLSAERDPVSGKSWFSFLNEILEIDRERLVAVASPMMGTSVRTIKDKIQKFPDYKHALVGDHRKNFPADHSLRHLFSIKSQEERGSMQLTLAEARDPQGQPVLLLDADIDENGNELAHLADLFKHKFTGGTHPYDIHEYLTMAHPGLPFGYELV